MLTAGIICEYNPFHNGHAYLIQRIKEMGATHIIAVMSGNFVQRGDAAILSKWARTRQALLCGADLVVELPLPWAVAGAERFALGGVSILDTMGADCIGFGSECGSIEALSRASEALFSPSLREALQKELKNGTTFAVARQAAVATLFGAETAKLLTDPNNILGIEYMKAIKRLDSKITPLTIRRLGSAHDSDSLAGEFASSSRIRKLLNAEDVSALMPQAASKVLQEELAAGRAPAGLFNMERGVLAQLRGMTKDDFASLPDISEGLEGRIYRAVRQAKSLQELYFLAKTKRYPLARIRRIILSAFLGLKAEHTVGTPPYLRILGIGKQGPELLKQAASNRNCPILSRPSDLASLSRHAQRIAALEGKATDLYALCLPETAPCGLDWTQKMITFY